MAKQQIKDTCEGVQKGLFYRKDRQDFAKIRQDKIQLFNTLRTFANFTFPSLLVNISDFLGTRFVEIGSANLIVTLHFQIFKSPNFQITFLSLGITS